MSRPAPRVVPDLLAVLGLGSVTSAFLVAAAQPLARYPLEAHPGALARAAAPALVLVALAVAPLVRGGGRRPAPVVASLAGLATGLLAADALYGPVYGAPAAVVGVVLAAAVAGFLSRRAPVAWWTALAASVLLGLFALGAGHLLHGARFVPFSPERYAGSEAVDLALPLVALVALVTALVRPRVDLAVRAGAVAVVCWVTGEGLLLNENAGFNGLVRPPITSDLVYRQPDTFTPESVAAVGAVLALAWCAAAVRTRRPEHAALVLAMVTITAPATVLVLHPEATAPTWVLLAAGLLLLALAGALQTRSGRRDPARAPAPEPTPAPLM